MPAPAEAQMPEPEATAEPPGPRKPSRTAPEATGTSASLLPAIAGTAGLLLLALAFARPDLPLMWAPIAVAGLILAGWWNARADLADARRRLGRLDAERAHQAREMERLADTAWELREGEERYRSLVDAQGDLVVRRDRAGRVTFANDAFATAFGRAAADFAGRPLGVGQPPMAPLGADVRTTDVKLETVRGPRWYAWVDIPSRDDDGQPGACLSVARDITERKASEQALVDARTRAEAANEAKSRLLATVSHEFRTPLNGILGLTMLLRESGLTTEQQTYARGVQSSGETLLALVDDMLDFSRIEAGRLALHPEPTDIERLVQEVVELLAARAHHKGIDLAADVAPGLPRVWIDPVRVRQVLTNLVGNGIKFTDAGGVRVSVRVGTPGADGKAALRFTVSDTGPGVAPADAERLFAEFEQLDSAPARRHGGAGLGLAISRRLAHLMGGDLRLSEPQAGSQERGATFMLDLTAPVASGPPTGRTDGDALAGRRVLILARPGVEGPLAARQLAAAGAEARVAGTLSSAGGLLAASAAAGQPYHAVLIDARLPVAPERALEELRQAAGGRLSAAILLEPGERTRAHALRAAGFAAYLVRPLRRASLVKVVRGMVAGDTAFLADPRDDEATTVRVPAPDRAVDVLLAEDNEINAMLARAVLEGLGHPVTAVRDGAEALAAIEARENAFGAILMDLHMPGLDGLAAARAVRAREKEAGAAPVPILAVTADVLPQTRDAAREAGITMVLEKPLTPESLRRALADALAGRDAAE